jgi:hypothetical protein
MVERWVFVAPVSVFQEHPDGISDPLEWYVSKLNAAGFETVYVRDRGTPYWIEFSAGQTKGDVTFVVGPPPADSPADGDTGALVLSLIS